MRLSSHGGHFWIWINVLWCLIVKLRLDPWGKGTGKVYASKLDVKLAKQQGADAYWQVEGGTKDKTGLKAE